MAPNPLVASSVVQTPSAAHGTSTLEESEVVLPDSQPSSAHQAAARSRVEQEPNVQKAVVLEERGLAVQTYFMNTCFGLYV